MSARFSIRSQLEFQDRGMRLSASRERERESNRCSLEGRLLD